MCAVIYFYKRQFNIKTDHYLIPLIKSDGTAKTPNEHTPVVNTSFFPFSSDLRSPSLDKAFSKLVSERMNGRCSNRDLWTTEGNNCSNRLFNVMSDTSEFKSVVILFKTTLPGSMIHCLERIENQPLYELFSAQYKVFQDRDMALSHDTVSTENICRRLFHGTEAVEEIINPDDGHGFAPLLCGTKTGKIWGDGVYFAKNAKYCDSYARTRLGRKQMLIVDVIVWRSVKGKEGMKLMPLVPGTLSRAANSFVDDIHNPTIFVVQNSSDAYPAYLITYT